MYSMSTFVMEIVRIFRLLVVHGVDKWKLQFITDIHKTYLQQHLQWGWGSTTIRLRKRNQAKNALQVKGWGKKCRQITTSLFLPHGEENQFSLQKVTKTERERKGGKTMENFNVIHSATNQIKAPKWKKKKLQLKHIPIILHSKK